MFSSSPCIDFDPLTAVVLGMNSAPSQHDSDDELMQRIQRNEEEAFAILVRRYTTAIHSFVYRMCGNQHDAEDFTQETFLRLWRRADRWSPQTSKFSTWVHQIARNVVVDAHRRETAAKRQSGGFVSETTEDIVGGLETNNRVKEMHLALKTLPERQRTALVLCQVQGWKQDEAAIVLSTSVNGVQALINRARRALRLRLNASVEEGGV